MWNWCKTISIVSFWMGFFENISYMQGRSLSSAAGGGVCIDGAGGRACPAGTVPAVEAGEGHDGDTWYSVSLFFMWLRVLHLISVNKDLGPLVVVIGRMGRDMLIFGVIWGVLLLAFSSAVHGTGLENTAEVDAACNALLGTTPDEPAAAGGAGLTVCVCMHACMCTLYVYVYVYVYVCMCLHVCTQIRICVGVTAGEAGEAACM
jgi:hypothetical protein